MAHEIKIEIPEGPRDQVIQEIVDAIKSQLIQKFPNPDDFLSDNIITVNNDRS